MGLHPADPAMWASGRVVGRVRSGSSDFEVEVDGQQVPILEAPEKAADMADDSDDPELSEYLVRCPLDRLHDLATGFDSGEGYVR